MAAPGAGAPSSQYCWWKVPKPHGGHSPGAQAAAGTGGSGVSTRKLRKLAGVTCAARLARGELPQPYPDPYTACVPLQTTTRCGTGREQGRLWRGRTRSGG